MSVDYVCMCMYVCLYPYNDGGFKYRVWVCSERKEQRMLLQDIGEC